MATTYDCVLCGACCVSPFGGEGYIQVDPEEGARMRGLSLPVIELRAGEETLRFLGTRVTSEGRRICQALEGKVGRRVACAVYEDRPSLCRQFEAGSPECVAARRAVGIY